MPSRQSQLALSLLACFLAGLGGGTLYLYSAYAPQVASRLSLNATSTSFIGMVGNLGTALAGPIAGSVVDRKGFLTPLLVGGLSTFVGYYVVRYLYKIELGSVPILAGALLLVGLGSSFAFSAAVKCAAVNFPKSRGFATSVPMAAFGLSAFVISATASIFVPGDTYGFLTLLTFLPMTLFAVGLKFIRNIPDYEAVPQQEAIEMNQLRTSAEPHHDKPPIDIRGTTLLKNKTFWAHFAVMGLLSGVGQMYIYSCGYVAKALVLAPGSTKVSEESLQQLQSLQVGIISLSSFSGRLISGSLSDYITHKHNLQRTWLLVGAGTISLMTQIAGLMVSDTSHLWMLSIGTGLSYGLCYGAYPTIVGDSFGMKHFSQNWGLLALSPVVASYLLNMLFGYYYDVNSITDASGAHVCIQGRACYSNAFKVTVNAAIIVVFIALEIIISGRKRTSH
ncbi:hypothetical protein TRVA0_034S01200 [Trichomonascus vanleenenianus]|uniref:uncharacterized protein n=1 Tax=Trichomonascus vanleenenianus TaxID=2268995 RepID=UPI003ECB972A